MPLSNLAWQFENSNVDSVSSIAPTTSSGPPTYNASGKYGSSIVFNNTPGATTGAYYLKYTTGISLSTVTSFTICLWIKPLALGANATGNQRYISISDGGTFFTFGTVPSNPTSIFFYGQNPYTVPNNITGALQTAVQGQWIHATVVFSGTAVTTYYNGINKDNLSLVVSPVTFNALGLGNRSAINVDGAANCELDDLRIYNTTLTAAQVQSIYRAQGMPSRTAFNNTLGTVKSYFTNS